MSGRPWTAEESRIAVESSTPSIALKRLAAAGYSRTRAAVWQHRTAQKAHDNLGATGNADLAAWVLWPRLHQPTARRVFDWIEANSPMTLQQFEAGMREMEGRP